MIATSFLGRAAELCIARAHYETGRALAQEAIELSRRIHLEFAATLCLLTRVHAEIGLRQRRSIRRGLAELETLKARNEDPYVDLALQTLHIRVALMDGEPLESPGLLTPPSGELQKSGQGSFWSLLAISHILAGRLEDARECLSTARTLTRAVEPVFYTHFAAIILLLVESEDAREVLPKLASLLRETERHEVLDAFVIAYRACPSLLSLAADEPTAANIVTRVVTLAGDHHLAATAGLSMSQPLSGGKALDLLTPREREVLTLLVQGLTNGEIAGTLFISESTAKVHVHHIFEKLNVSTRTQAVLRAQELLDEGN
jgi:ATP/maltotriose-dependent transcriptional regulator MalT